MVEGDSKTPSQMINLNVWALMGSCLGQPREFQLSKPKKEVGPSSFDLVDRQVEFLYEMVIESTFVCISLI